MAAIVGAAAGLAFGEKASIAFGGDDPCDALWMGEKLKLIDAAKRKALVDSVLTTSDLSPMARQIMQRLTDRSVCQP